MSERRCGFDFGVERRFAAERASEPVASPGPVPVEPRRPAPGAPIVVAFETRAALPITDRRTALLAIVVNETAPMRGLRVRVELDHPRAGELVLTLSPPAAVGLRAVVLQDRAAASAGRLQRSYGLLTTPAFVAAMGRPPAGTWILAVASDARGGEGVLRALRLELTV